MLKLRSIKILLLCFIFCIDGYSQKALSATEFDKAKSLYRELSKTDSYKQYRTDLREIIVKMGMVNTNPFTTSETDFIQDVQKSLSQTKFASIDEAVELKRKVNHSYNQLRESNKEVYTLILKANSLQLREICEPDREQMVEHYQHK